MSEVLCECGRPIHLTHSSPYTPLDYKPHRPRVAGRAVQDDGLDVERLAAAMSESCAFCYGQSSGTCSSDLHSTRAAASVLARLRAAPPLPEPES